jgi:hypothetical protein
MSQPGKTLSVLSLFLLLLFYPGIALNPFIAWANTFEYSEVRTLGNGMAWSWVEYDNEGKPAAIGVTFTETALEGLPEKPVSAEDYSYEHVLPLPRRGAKPYTHIGLDWNPVGHLPPGIYDMPHFDMHFYLITTKERDKITLKGKDQARAVKKPQPKYIPEGYILPKGTEVPEEGVHWIDPSAPEFNKQPFNYTFIYGTYNGKLAFIEPMVAFLFLKNNQNVSVPIKLPRAFQKAGYYPASYSIKFDSVRKEYSLSLDGLTYKKARAERK